MQVSSENNAPRSRIPLALQSVFLAANQGHEVELPPPDSSACKVYKHKSASRRWFGLGRRFSMKKESPDSSNHSSESLARKNPGKGSKNPNKKKVTTNVPRTPAQVVELDNAFIPKPVKPHSYLESLLQSRGYPIKTVKATECAYHNKATPLQEASYGTAMVGAIRGNDVKKLRELLEIGLSPNACNMHKESIVHLACRSGFTEILKILLQYGCKLQVCDDNGRTPLHEACWSADLNFDVVEMIIKVDWQMLLVTDSRGFVPLSYVREQNYSAFTKFLVKTKNSFLPDKLFGDDKSKTSLLTQNFNAQCVVARPISVQMARLVAQGKMSPEEVELLSKGDDGEEMVDSDSESSDDEDDDDDDASQDSDFSFDEQEMAELLRSIGTVQPVAW
eukprot:scaffold17818_cov199-Amphora_coffeaeformis.AAC.4